MRKWLPGLFALMIVLGRCESDNPITPVDPTPQIAGFISPDTLFTTTSNNYYFMIDVQDPQGPGDIQSVTCDITPEGSNTILVSLTLVDDGTNGDVIPKDGTFTTPLPKDFSQGQTGTFELKVTAIDQAGNQDSKISTWITVIAGEENNPPIVSEFMAPSSISLEKTVDYLFTVKVTDPQGDDNLAAVLLDFFSPIEPTSVLQDTLFDNGQNGDETNNDGTYAAAIAASTFDGFTPGIYSVRVQAVDQAGAKSNPQVQDVEFMLEGNDPPVIANVVAPDTMRLPPRGAVQAVLSVDVTDPQGPLDIREVLFNSTKPDGNPSSGNPFFLADDGNSAVNGDETAGDGTYSLMINLPVGTPTGVYTFVFEAVDFSDAVSNKISHTITVIQ